MKQMELELLKKDIDYIKAQLDALVQLSEKRSEEITDLEIRLKVCENNLEEIQNKGNDFNNIISSIITGVIVATAIAIMKLIR